MQRNSAIPASLLHTLCNNGTSHERRRCRESRKGRARKIRSQIAILNSYRRRQKIALLTATTTLKTLPPKSLILRCYNPGNRWETHRAAILHFSHHIPLKFFRICAIPRPSTIAKSSPCVSFVDIIK